MMLTGTINSVDMLIGELYLPSSGYPEVDHVYKAASLLPAAGRVSPEEAVISRIRQDRLTFDGTQYVMTSYHPSAEDRIEIELKRSETDEIKYVFGCRSSGVSVQDSFYLACAYNCIYAAIGNDENIIVGAVEAGKEHIITMSSDGYYQDGELKKTYTSSSFNSQQTLCIGGLNEGGYTDSRLFEGEIYSARIYRGNMLLHEFVPAEEGGHKGFFDIQTGSFYPRCSVSGGAVVKSGIPPVTIYPDSSVLSDCIIYGSSRGVGDYDSLTEKYLIPVNVRGRNLFDKNNADILSLYPDQDGTVTASGAEKQRSFCMSVRPNTQYTVSVRFTGNVSAVVAGYPAYPHEGDSCEFADSTLVSLSPAANTFITNNNTHYILCYFSDGRDTNELDEVLAGVQVEKGGEVTEYVPYRISHTVLYADQPLMYDEFISASELSQEIEICSGFSVISVSTQVQPDRITVRYSV